MRVETTRETNIERAETFDQRRIDSECFRKPDISRNESAAEIRAANLFGRWIDKIISIKESLSRPQRKVVDGTQQPTIVKNTGAESHDRLPIPKRIVRERHSGSPIIAIFDYAFVFVANTETKKQTLPQ